MSTTPPTQRLLDALILKAADGSLISAELPASLIKTESGKDISQALTEAVGQLKDNGDGTTLPAEVDSLKKLADSLTLLQTTLNTFLTGEADGGEVDRLKELVAEITANRDNIAAITAGKVNVTDIINTLTSTDTTKPLAAAQGKALKDLVDALTARAHEHANAATLAKLGEKDGLLTLGGVSVSDGMVDCCVAESLETIPANLRTGGVAFILPAAV